MWHFQCWQFFCLEKSCNQRIELTEWCGLTQPSWECCHRGQHRETEITGRWRCPFVKCLSESLGVDVKVTRVVCSHHFLTPTAEPSVLTTALKWPWTMTLTSFLDSVLISMKRKVSINMGFHTWLLPLVKILSPHFNKPRVGSWVAQIVKESACNAGNPSSIARSGRYLEKGMATHSSILSWRIPWREEPGRLQCMGSQRVGHNWATNTKCQYRYDWKTLIWYKVL